ncbi:hypothetical protein EI94DRAFT_1730867 [Lactarius quietus]|nr:hypothetical protein EI94DRAFT_1730867 [Lactarius quietus]
MRGYALKMSAIPNQKPGQGPSAGPSFLGPATFCCHSRGLPCKLVSSLTFVYLPQLLSEFIPSLFRSSGDKRASTAWHAQGSQNASVEHGVPCREKMHTAERAHALSMSSNCTSRHILLLGNRARWLSTHFEHTTRCLRIMPEMWSGCGLMVGGCWNIPTPGTRQDRIGLGVPADAPTSRRERANPPNFFHTASGCYITGKSITPNHFTVSQTTAPDQARARRARRHEGEASDLYHIHHLSSDVSNRQNFLVFRLSFSHGLRL